MLSEKYPERKTETHPVCQDIHTGFILGKKGVLPIHYRLNTNYWASPTISNVLVVPLPLPKSSEKFYSVIWSCDRCSNVLSNDDTFHFKATCDFFKATQILLNRYSNIELTNAFTCISHVDHHNSPCTRWTFETQNRKTLNKQSHRVYKARARIQPYSSNSYSRAFSTAPI